MDSGVWILLWMRCTIYSTGAKSQFLVASDAYFLVLLQRCQHLWLLSVFIILTQVALFTTWQWLCHQFHGLLVTKLVNWLKLCCRDRFVHYCCMQKLLCHSLPSKRPKHQPIFRPCRRFRRQRLAQFQAARGTLPKRNLQHGLSDFYVPLLKLGLERGRTEKRRNLKVASWVEFFLTAHDA